MVHTHDRVDDLIEVAKIKTGFKETALLGHVRPANILATGLQTASDEAKDLVKLESCRRVIRRHKRGIVPPDPATTRDLVIADEWKTTGGPTPRPFLIHDSGPRSDDRVVVYATEEGLRLLASSSTWFMDGTFSTAPAIFVQLYVISATIGTTCASCVYAFLAGKTEAIYTEMLGAVVTAFTSLGFNGDPTTIITDFEHAVISAVQVVLGPHVRRQGYFFHLTQSTWRKIQELGLAAHYRSDAAEKHFCGMLDGLAFLPLAEVAAGMTHLRGIAPPELLDLVDYFDATYVTGRYRVVQLPAAHAGGAVPPRRVRLQPPAFPPDIWNVHDATINSTARTNNMCEAWNSAFTKAIGHAHPSFWTVVGALRKDAAIVSTMIVQDARGQPPQKRTKRAYADLQARLRALCQDRTTGRKTMEDFLRGVGHCVRFK